MIISVIRYLNYITFVPVSKDIRNLLMLSLLVCRSDAFWRSIRDMFILAKILQKNKRVNNYAKINAQLK